MARSGQWRRLRADYRSALRRIRALEEAASARRERLWQAGQIVGILERERAVLIEENACLREALHEARVRRA